MSEIVRSASVPFARIVGFPGGPGPKGDVGPVGPKGDRGDVGPAGVAGSATINGFDVNNTSRLVGSTVLGGGSAANTWAKVLTLSATANYSVANLILGFGGARFTGSNGATDSAIVSVRFTVNSPTESPQVVVGVDVLASGGRSLDGQSFKIVSGQFADPAELWVRKTVSEGGFQVYELSRGLLNPTRVSLQYHSNSPWQATEPVGSVNNVTSAGVTAFGRPVGTRVSVPALPSSAGLAGQWAADDTNFYVYGASGWRRAALQTWSTANKVDLGDEAVDE